MKKNRILTVLLMITIMISLVSCNKDTDNNIESSKSTTDDMNYTSECTEPNNDKKLEESHIPTQTINEDSDSSIQNDGAVGDSISYSFYSYDDYHKFMTNEKIKKTDLSKNPSPFFDESVPNGVRKYYIPLKELFELDTKMLDSIEEFSYSYRGTFNYYFEIDRCVVYVKYDSSIKENDDIKQCFNLSSSTPLYTKLSAKEQYDYCAIKRSVDGKESICIAEDGEIRNVRIVLGNYKIIISFLYDTQNNTASELNDMYNRFMTDEKTAFFAAFFSEDDAVYRQAMERIEKIL